MVAADASLAEGMVKKVAPWIANDEAAIRLGHKSICQATQDTIRFCAALARAWLGLLNFVFKT